MAYVQFWKATRVSGAEAIAYIAKHRPNNRLGDMGNLISKALKSGKIKMRFWACSDCVGSSVKWVSGVAICQSCKRKSTDKPNQHSGQDLHP